VAISSLQIACDPVKQSLAALRSGQENFARFITELFADFESLTQKLCAAQTQLAQNERMESAADPNSAELSAASDALQAKVAELEEERRQLEEELENVRTHSVNMQQVIDEQKRQMAEENAGWTAELRQLRRILDKQATWIAQQRENSPQYAADLESQQFTGPAEDDSPGQPPILPIRTAQNPNRQIQQQPAAMRATGTAGQAGRHDAVLGSVLSQFELLQRDVARRRDQNMHLHAK
jgi:chromosome segregation ATPase